MNIRPTKLLLTATVVLCTAAGCSPQDSTLQISELTAAERTYCEHIITLERAKAIAYIDRTAGDTILDSLLATWGDSAATQTARDLSSDPYRTAAFADFLALTVAAEQDSIRAHPGHNRLLEPIPVPSK